MISQKEIHRVAVDHLFWQHPVNIAEKLCLIHSEVSEAMEADRARDPVSSKTDVGEELADIVIRVLDLAEYLEIDLEAEVEKKHEVNKTRSIRHGKRY